MADILDALNDLEDDDDFADLLEEDEFLTGVVVEEKSYDLEDYDMNERQAQEITDAIRSAATATYVLLAEAHKHKAHKALGYDTWAAYVEAEFDMSSQRSYQLLALSRVANEIEEALPEGAQVKLTEAQARDIKRELPKITEEITEVTQEMTPEEAAAKAEEIVEHHREEARAQREADAKAVKEKQAEFDQAQADGYSAGLEAAADALLGEAEDQGSLDADRADGMSNHADDGLVELEVEGSGNVMSPEVSMNLFNFFNALAGITSLPEPEDFLKTVPRERRGEVNNQLLEAAGWLNRFQTLWEMEEESDD